MGSIPSTPVKETPPLRHIWIITGPSGCGKSTIAQFIARELQLPYIEGDDYHSESNVQKMANGIPLTDDDRWSWLETLRNKAVEALTFGSDGCVVTCSALKRKYRDIIRLAGHAAPDVVVRFVYLQASQELLLQRVKARAGHFFKDNMVKGQFEILEEPDETEQDVLVVPVKHDLPIVKALALQKVELVMQESS
ncbi:carbohydrate kinase [Ascobolus immersus RN42]|uniref:Gluconokinase n=1 Tax=Ascobolus immersus RN42 TaxID=1160509 RepID=A0A3N4IDH7_ASCIM|nr:carbohydrate kinase [Ascobolus immersus RN42]